eukprot:TRINITY_DN73162_c0_g1_i1.p1 TRINITY_DN73162_c0_g1~~TRINITY_DN73162_c0_g1_i1.p1  ORF type:complete len:472 (+),score=61.02 TRINITY_DN73162_c0_g1_i1:136-1551(+)
MGANCAGQGGPGDNVVTFVEDVAAVLLPGSPAPARRPALMDERQKRRPVPKPDTQRCEMGTRRHDAKPRESPKVQIEVATIGSGVIGQLEVPEDACIALVKEMIDQRLGIPAEEQRLALGSDVLADERTVLDLASTTSAPVLDEPAAETDEQRIQTPVSDTSDKAGAALRLALVRVPRRLALSGGSDKTLRLWDLERQELVRVLRGHTGAVHCLSADWAGHRALSGSGDRSLRLWDLRTGKGTVLGSHMKGILCLDADWVSKRALTGSCDRSLILWDLEAHRSLLHLKGHDGWVSCVTVDWHTNRALSGSTDGLKLWDLRLGTLLESYRSPDCAVLCLSMDWSASRALNACMSTMLHVWDVKSRETLLPLRGHRDLIKCVEVDWQFARAVSGSRDRSMILWNLKTGGGVDLRSPGGSVECLAVDWSAERAVSGGSDKMLTVWDLERAAPCGRLRGHTGVVECIAMSGGCSS